MLRETEDRKSYKVVVNHELQYSIWPADRPNAPGWNDEGTSGLKQECLDHIDKVWTDMRPLSLQKKMAEYKKKKQSASKATKANSEEPPRISVVERLSKPRQPVSMRRYQTPEELLSAISRGFVLAKFTETAGGTEIGFKIDTAKSACDASRSSGPMRLVGRLTLDYVPVECQVDVDPQTLEGFGQLTPVPAGEDASG